MIKRIVRYLFPPLRHVEKLPLLPTRISGEYSVYGKPPAHLADDIFLLKALSLARTDADAHRLLIRYRDVPLRELIRHEQRHRRREPRIKKAWRRLKARW